MDTTIRIAAGRDVVALPFCPDAPPLSDNQNNHTALTCPWNAV